MVLSLRRYSALTKRLELFALDVNPCPDEIYVAANTLIGMLQHFHAEKVTAHGAQYIGVGEDALIQGANRQTLGGLEAAVDPKNTAIVGIGALERTFGRTMLDHVLSGLGISDEPLRDRGAVGDILFHAIDINGFEVPFTLHRLLSSVKLGKLQRVVGQNRVVGVATDQLKAPAVYGVLNRRYINSLIADHNLVENVLKIDDQFRAFHNEVKPEERKEWEQAAQEAERKAIDVEKRAVKEQGAPETYDPPRYYEDATEEEVDRWYWWREEGEKWFKRELV
jgi:hypothetical protein